MLRRLLVGLAAAAAVSTAEAQIFSGPATFVVGPTTTMGTLTNNLTITNTPTGFIVAGQVLVSVPAAPVNGLLVSWTIARPLNPTWGSGTLTTSTVLDGFSAPPIGVSGNTLGVVETFFSNPGPGSSSTIPMSLVGGVDLPPWINITATSAPFAYTSGGVHFMLQRFVLDGSYLAGPGGTWTIDVPVISDFSPIPEPTMLLLPAAGLGAAAWLWRKRKARQVAC